MCRVRGLGEFCNPELLSCAADHLRRPPTGDVDFCMRACSLLSLILFLTFSACGINPPSPKGPPAVPLLLSAEEAAALPAEMQAQLPLHTPKQPPERGEWLNRHEEWPENFEQFVRAEPVKATPERRTVYITLLGEFTAEQRQMVELAREYLEICFQLPVQMSDELQVALVPAHARRDEGSYGVQLFGPYILRSILKPRMPRDAAASIAFTAWDLYPAEDWGFCFGQAMLQERVGVWSISRFGDPSESEEAFDLALRRTLHTASHETAHMFSLTHCVYFECAMNGANHRTEMDTQPLWLCPQCQAKLCYATGGDVRKQLTELVAFAERNGLKEEEEFWRGSLTAIEAAK